MSELKGFFHAAATERQASRSQVLKRKCPAVFVTYHKVDLDVIGDVFKAFEADYNLVLCVVQVAQMEYNDLITSLYGETNNILSTIHLYCSDQ